MVGEDQAGRSGDDRARDIRRRMARLENQALRIEAGSLGEKRTAQALNPRSGDGWSVFHDLAVPGSKANIDHLVITPCGVFVVDSKNWRGSIWQGRDTILVGRYPKRDELGTVAWEVGLVASILKSALPDWPLRVQGVLSLTGDPPSRPVLQADEITAVGVDDLVHHLAGFPAHLGPEHVDVIARVVDAKLHPRAGGDSSLVRPDPLPPRPPAPQSPPARRHPPAQWVAEASVHKRPTVSWRPAGGSRRRPAQSPGSKTLPQIVVVIGAIVVVLVAVRALPSVLKNAARLPAATTHSTATTLPPAGLSVKWSCPTPGRGWTATLVWPPGRVPSGTAVVETAPSRSGPWNFEQFLAGGDPVVLSNIKASDREWIRAGNYFQIVDNGQAEMQGELVAPSGC